MGTFQIYIIGTLLAVSLGGTTGAWWLRGYVERGQSELQCNLKQSEAIVTALSAQRNALTKATREEARNNALKLERYRKIVEGVNHERDCENTPVSPCRRAFLESVQRMRDAK